MKDKKFLSTTELAKILGISRIAVYKRIKNGKIKARKIGHDFVIDIKDLGDILEKGLKKEEKLEIEKTQLDNKIQMTNWTTKLID